MSIPGKPSRNLFYTRKHLFIKNKDAILFSNKHFFDKKAKRAFFVVSFLSPLNGTFEFFQACKVPSHTFCKRATKRLTQKRERKFFRFNSFECIFQSIRDNTSRCFNANGSQDCFGNFFIFCQIPHSSIYREIGFMTKDRFPAVGKLEDMTTLTINKFTLNAEFSSFSNKGSKSSMSNFLEVLLEIHSGSTK